MLLLWFQGYSCQPTVVVNLPSLHDISPDYLFPTIVSRNRKIFSQKGIQFVTANKEHCFMQLGLPDVWSTDKWRKDGFSTNQWVPGSHGGWSGCFQWRGTGFDSIKPQLVFFPIRKRVVRFKCSKN